MTRGPHSTPSAVALGRLRRSSYRWLRGALGVLWGVVGLVSLAHSQIVLRGTAQAGLAASGNLVVGAPAGVAERDVLFATVALGASGASVVPPAGWALLQDTPQATANSLRVMTFYKVASASEPGSYVWTPASVGTGAVLGLSAWAGVDTANPVMAKAAAATAPALRHSTPSVSPSAAHSVLVSAYAYASASPWQLPADFSPAGQVQAPAQAAAQGVSLALGYAQWASQQPTGSRTATATAYADAGATQAWLLRRAEPAVQLVASASAATQGAVVTFLVTVPNPTTSDLNDVVVTDVLPASMAYVSSAASMGAVASAANKLVWTIPTIAPGESAQLTVAVTLVQSGVLANTVTSNVAGSATASVLSLVGSVSHYRMDGPAGSWKGTAGEVLDSGGDNRHGRLLATTSPTLTNEVVPGTTIAAQVKAVNGNFCNAANFDRKGVVEVPRSTFFDFKTQFSASAWVYPTAHPATTGADMHSILSNDVNYEFHIDRNGKLYWWWGGPTLTSSTPIPLNQWTHVAITFNSAEGRQRIYINGVADASTRAWKGSLSPNPCNFYIGGDVATGSCRVLRNRNFPGLIDEVKLYNTELNAAQVEADRTIGRSCAGTFDHLQIEHDAQASVCTPETVTIKACQNASCSTLFPGDVQVQLLPSGRWVGGDSFTLRGGVATRQISQSSAGTAVLGASNMSPGPGYPTRCVAGGKETCDLAFAAASCTFDAVEPGAPPKSRLFTKLAGTPFDIDVLALQSSGALNTAYLGAVRVDLVDASAADCPSGAGLGSAQSTQFDSASRGRQRVALRYPDAAANVRVRMQVASSAPACSSDNFAIRPVGFAVASPGLTNATLQGGPTGVAGKPFTLRADAGVSRGYTGSSPTVVESRVQDHAGNAIAPGVLLGGFTAGSGSYAQGDAFRYLDVGSLQFGADAVVDSAFTAVDQKAGDCVVGSTATTLSNGRYGCTIGSTRAPRMGRWVPSHYSFSGTLRSSCASGGFTYMDEDALGIGLTVKAHAHSGNTESASDPVVSRYTSGYTPLAAVQVQASNAGVPVDVARLVQPAFPTTLLTTGWNNGVWAVNDTFAFAKAAAPDGPFDDFKLRVVVQDPDGRPVVGTADSNTTRLRYGQLRLTSAYGSERLPLALPLEARYWNGTFFAPHTADSCTRLGVSSLTLSDYTGTLQPCETTLRPPTVQTLSAGRWPAPGVVLSAPAQGHRGSVLLTLNTGGTATGNTCLSAQPSAASAAKLPWLGPVAPARATFGVYTSPYIYLRENY